METLIDNEVASFGREKRNVWKVFKWAYLPNRVCASLLQVLASVQGPQAAQGGVDRGAADGEQGGL